MLSPILRRARTIRHFCLTLPTLLKLRDDGYKLGVASKGQAVKQWQKLIQLGLEHIFHAVTISEETGSETLTKATFAKTVLVVPIWLRMLRDNKVGLTHHVRLDVRVR